MTRNPIPEQRPIRRTSHNGVVKWGEGKENICNTFNTNNTHNKNNKKPENLREITQIPTTTKNKRRTSSVRRPNALRGDRYGIIIPSVATTTNANTDKLRLEDNCKLVINHKGRNWSRSRSRVGDSRTLNLVSPLRRIMTSIGANRPHSNAHKMGQNRRTSRPPLINNTFKMNINTPECVGGSFVSPYRSGAYSLGGNNCNGGKKMHNPNMYIKKNLNIQNIQHK